MEEIDHEKLRNKINPGKYYEYYGFVLYLGSAALFILYLIWSLVPDEILRSYGLYFYSKYWTLVLPTYFMVIWLYLFILFIGYTLNITPDVSDPSAFTDEYALLQDIPSYIDPQIGSDIVDIDLDSVHKYAYNVNN